MENVCEQLSQGDTFLSNSAQQGGAVAILGPALNSGRYILSVTPAVGPTSILRLPCAVNSALANATFAENKAVVSGGAVYAVSTPVVGALLSSAWLAACSQHDHLLCYDNSDKLIWGSVCVSVCVVCVCLCVVSLSLSVYLSAPNTTQMCQAQHAN